MHGQKRFVLDDEEERHGQGLAAGPPATFQIEQPLAAVLQSAKSKPRKRTIDVIVGQDKVWMLNVTRALLSLIGPYATTCSTNLLQFAGVACLTLCRMFLHCAGDPVF